MHQITVIEPKWLSEVAPTFFRVADQNKISKRKASEKIEPLFDRFAANKDDWVSLKALRALPTDILLSVSASKNELPARLRPSIRSCTLQVVCILSIAPYWSEQGSESCPIVAD